MKKLNKQCSVLKACPATMKQTMHMTNSIIHIRIAYGFYTIAFSIPTINKLDKILLHLQKHICGFPKNTPNITIQLPHTLFGLEAFFLHNDYLRYIGKQL